VLTVIFLSSPLQVFAYDADSDEKSGTLSLVVENDIFHSDSYYTNGVRLSWLSEPGSWSGWARRAARLFPFFPEEATVMANYSIGQNMYTPKDIKLENPPSDDRPYAGWLYGSVGLIAETGKQLDQFEVTLGMVGPASLAEESQKNVHKLIGSDKPMGWDHQLKNEPGIIVTYQRSWRSFVSKSMLGVPYDITPHAGGALGNIFTYANTGVLFRYGNKLQQDYGPPRIQPSMPGSGFFIPQDGMSWYLFAGAEGRAVARNIFLDGNTFAESGSVEKEIFLGDLQLGLVLSWKNYRFGYTHVLRTREFKNQSLKSQEFGAISLSILM